MLFRSPPPALNQIVTPDINRLGLLDCQGPQGFQGLTEIGAGIATTCGQYLGFPITNPNQRQQLIQLGKALFWDMQVGSDGVQACATCHFHAGADSRTVNQLSPGLNRYLTTKNSQLQIKNAINPSQLNPTAGPESDVNLDGGKTANYHLTSGDFPRASDVRREAVGGPNFGNNDVTSSQGVHLGTFGTVTPGARNENGAPYAGQDIPAFNLNGTKTARRVEPRNTPTTIGAGFNLRNFWDGRANQFFNGVNPFGMTDPSGRIKISSDATVGTAGVNIADQQVMIPFSSLASQAVGPPGSAFEMSLDGRQLRDIAHKLFEIGRAHV